MPSISEMAYFGDPSRDEYARYKEELDQKARDRKLAQEQAARDRQYDFGEARATVPNRFGERVARGFHNAREDFNSYYVKDWVPGIGGVKLGDFLLGQTPEEIKRWSEGNSPWVEARGVDGSPVIPTVTFKTGRRDPVYDVAMTGADIAGIATGGAKAANKAINVAKPIVQKYGPEMAADMARASQGFMPNQAGIPQVANRFTPGGMRNPEGSTSAGGPLYAVKQPSGQWHPDVDLAEPYKTGQDQRHLWDMWNLNPRVTPDLLKEAKALGVKKQKPEVDALEAQLKSLNETGPIGMEVKPIVGNETRRLESLIRDGEKVSEDDLAGAAWQDTVNSLDYRIGLMKGKAGIPNLLEAADEVAKLRNIPSPYEADKPRETANKWVDNIFNRYQRTQFGTEKDPLRKLADTGVHRWMNPELDENSLATMAKGSRAIEAGREARVSQGVAPEPIAQTPMGQYFENTADEALGSARSFGDTVNDPTTSREWLAEHPWIEKTAQANPNAYMHWQPKNPESMYFLNQEAKKLADEGKMTPENMAKWSPEAVARSANERVLAEEARVAGSEVELREWATKRHEEVDTHNSWNEWENPDDGVFADGSKIAVFSSHTGEDLLKADLSLQTIACDHCIGSAGHDANKHIPMVMPHTGKPPKGAGEGLGGDYLRDIIDDISEVRALNDEKGWPQGTMKWDIVDRDYESGSVEIYDIEQIKGKDNGMLPAKYHKDLVDYLNKYQYHLGNVSDLDNIKASEANASDMHDSIKKVLGGDSEEKTKRLLKKASDGWNKAQRRMRNTYFTTPETIIDEIVNNDFMNGDNRFMLFVDEDDVYKKAFEKYTKE